MQTETIVILVFLCCKDGVLSWNKIKYRTANSLTVNDLQLVLKGPTIINTGKQGEVLVKEGKFYACNTHGENHIDDCIRPLAIKHKQEFCFVQHVSVINHRHDKLYCISRDASVAHIHILHRGRVGCGNSGGLIMVDAIRYNKMCGRSAEVGIQQYRYYGRTKEKARLKRRNGVTCNKSYCSFAGSYVIVDETRTIINEGRITYVNLSKQPKRVHFRFPRAS